MATSESVVVELLAKVDGFDGKVRGSASSFGTSMKQIEQSADRAERAVGTAMVAVDKSMAQTAQRSRLLGYQIADVGAQLSAGQSPFLIIAQQAPQMANALDGAGGALGRVAGFLSTWQGAVILAAATLASQFIPKLLESGNAVDDLVDKLRENEQKTKDANAANEVFADTIEGVEKALRENEEALKKLNLAQDTGAEAAYNAADAQRQKAIAIREATVALLEQAQAEFQSSREINFGAAGGAGAGAAQSIFAKRVNEVEGLLRRAEESLAKARTQTIEARAAVIVERASASKEDQINRDYDRRIDAARKLAVANGTVTTALEAQVKAIERAREADLKRYRDAEAARKKAERGSGSTTLPAVTGREIADALGAPIISGKRSAQRNRNVGGSKNSYHLSGQAIDIPLTVNGKPMTKAGIRAVLEPLGVEIKELLGPGDKNHDDHFHIAFGKRRLGPDQVADRQQRDAEEAERAIEAELRRRQSFENELANLAGAEIDARQALITSAEEIAKLELDAIEVARAKYDDNLNALVEQKKLTAEEAGQLRAINEERAKLRTELVKRREDERKFRMAEADRQRAAEFQGAVRGDEASILQGQLDLARTQQQRREIELRLLDLQFEEEKARNDYLIGYYERLRTQEGISESELAEAKAAAEIAALRNASLDQRRGQAQQGAAQSTAGPLESYMQSIPSTADEINEALESVAAGGLATFTDALTDAIVNFQSLGDVGLAVLQQITAALVRMAIQQLVVNTLAKTFGKDQQGSAEKAAAGIATLIAQQVAAQAIQASLGASTAATSAALASTVAAAWAPAAAAASLATLGGNAAPAAAALLATNALASALALPRKDGGPIFGIGGPRDDKVLMAASPGEYVIKARSAARLGRGALDYINDNGMLPGFADGGAVRFVRPTNAPVAGAGRSASVSMDEQFRSELRSAVADAARAMPPINLYPTLDPGSVVRAALNTPGGRKAFFDFASANSGKLKSSLE